MAGMGWNIRGIVLALLLFCAVGRIRVDEGRPGHVYDMQLKISWPVGHAKA